MNIYVVTVLEETQDGNYAYTCEKCSDTLEGAKKILKEVTEGFVKDYKENLGFDCEVTLFPTMSEITVNTDLEFVKLEIGEIELEEE